MEEKSWIDKGIEFWEKKDYEHAVECFKEGDKAGEYGCTANLGMCYYWGNGVEADLEKAAFYNEKAAKAGIPMAMYDTGLNYEFGYGVPQNIEKSLYWLKKAAEEKYADAFITLGDLYYCGEQVEKDMEKAFSYYKGAEKLGLKLAKLFLAGFYANGIVVEKDAEKAKSLYQEAYDYLYEEAVINNDSEAQFRLGSIFFFGKPEVGINPDYVQAAEWYHKAVENGNHQAENTLGIMYYLGLGVGQSYEEAFKWFEKSAERKNVAAIANMGKCYFLGRGVAKDLKKAADCHSKAANLGYANSQSFLGEMYMKGDGVEQNYSKAVYWLKAACDNGERSAFDYLGNCYRKGLGVEKDDKCAYELFLKGASMGELRAKVAQAECLIEGWGVNGGIALAFQILEKVCKDEEVYREQHISMTSHEDLSGHYFMEDPLDEVNLEHYAKAYYLLATLYYSGSGTKKDVGEAIRLLRVADKLGYRNEEKPEETAEKFLNKVIQEAEKEDISDTVDCYVEVRENSHKGERYQVVLHHANGEESVVKFQGRNKFIYLLALLVGHEGKSVNGLTTKHFSYMRDDLSDMASDVRVDTKSYEEWIDEFIYAEDENAQSMRRAEQFQTLGRCSYNPYRYSNAFSGANRAIKACCLTNEEFETFKLRSTGGRSAVTTISLDSSQIELPNSLQVYLDCLPTQKEIANYRPKASVWLPVKE